MTNSNSKPKLVGLGCEFQHSPYRQTYPATVNPSPAPACWQLTASASPLLVAHRLSLSLLQPATS